MQAAGGYHLLMPFAPFVVNLLELGLVGILDGVDLRLRTAAEHDIRAAARHVGGDRDRTRTAGLRDDVRLALVLFGVEHFVRDLRALQELRKPLRRLDRGGSDQDRLAALHAILDVLEDGLKFILFREEHQIGLVLADHRLVGRDHHHFKAIDLLKFEGFGVGRARHAGQLRVQPEIVLERDGRDGLIFLANLDALLGLDRLMQTVGPAASLHGAAGELIDDDHFPLAHDVFDIALVQGMRAQRRIQVMHEADIGGVVQAFAVAQQADLRHQLFDLLMAVFGQRRLFGFFIHGVVAGTVFDFLPDQARDQRVDLDVQLGAFLRRTRNDQGGARFVDQDRIDFVHDGKGQFALYAILQTKREVVAQVIEAEFIVRAVGDVAGVRRALLVGRLSVLDDAHLESQKAEHRTHPLRVALRQVFIDRNDMHALAGESVQVRRQGGHQRLTFARAHFRDLAGVQREAADQLNIEVTQPQLAARRFTHQGKGLGDQIVQRSTGRKARLELPRLFGELFVRQSADARLEGVHRRDGAAQLLHQALITAAKYLRQKLPHAGESLRKLGIVRIDRKSRKSFRRSPNPSSGPELGAPAWESSRNDKTILAPSDPRR